jgi:RND family efflux transporter MFP subunit
VVGCSGQKKEAAAAKSTVREVRVVAVESMRNPEVTELVGTVEPRNRAEISTKLQARVENIRVTLGAHVKKGDLLAEFDKSDILAKEAQAEAVATQTSKELQRYEELLRKELVAKEEYDRIKSQGDVAAANLNEVRSLLEYARVLAPFAGKVTKKAVDIGDLTSPGQMLFTVEEEGNLRMKVAIPEALETELSIGESLMVAIPTLDTTFSGTLAELSESADPMTHSFEAKVLLPISEQIRSGQYCKLIIPGTGVEAVTVPSSAVLVRGQLEVAYIIGEDARVSMRLVRTGKKSDGRTEVLSGLKVAEMVAVSGTESLVEGDSVKVAP